MSTQEVLRIEILPKLVNTICLTIVMLALIYTTYSYLLVQADFAKQPFTSEINTLRLQLKTETDKRVALEQENIHLNTRLATKEEQIKRLLTQVEGNETQEEASSQSCRIDNQEIDRDLIRKALQNTLSRKSQERFEGFAILMNHLDYLDLQIQREVIEFYLNKVDKRNRSGVYYSVFILSQFSPTILKEYGHQIEQTFSFVSSPTGWEKTSYKYCQLQSKINENSP